MPTSTVVKPALSGGAPQVTTLSSSESVLPFRPGSVKITLLEELSPRDPCSAGSMIAARDADTIIVPNRQTTIEPSRTGAVTIVIVVPPKSGVAKGCADAASSVGMTENWSGSDEATKET
jgi:hypothetical protein